jgi:type IV pilus assembly protein PilV
MIKKTNPYPVFSKRRKQEAGFTLLEVIVAISILTIGLLAVVSMQVSSIRGNYFSKMVTESSDNLQDKIEELLARPYSDPLLADGTGTNNGVSGLDDRDPNADQVVVIDSKYTVFWNVADNWAGSGTSAPAGKAMSGVKTIRVFVVWQDHGVQKEYTFDLMKTTV